ncbi:MAG: sugar ABC transporter permease [Anaerolineae bacterium]|nr:MAG: sugar ABC transporter permease [Anaerolineae bacterium]
MKSPLKLVLRLAGVALVAWAAWGLRAHAVAELPPDYDEDDYLRAAQLYADGLRAGDWRILTEVNYREEHPPLAKVLYALPLASLEPAAEIPDRPTSAGPAHDLPPEYLEEARAQAARFGTLEAILLALVNPLAGLFLAVHSFTIKYQSQVMLEALPALTSAALVLAYERSRVWETGRASGWLAASAVLLGLTAAGKYIYAVAGVAALAHWLWHGRGSLRKTLPLALGWGAVSLVVFFGANPYLWPDPLGRLSASVLYHAGYATGAAEVESAGFPVWQPLVWLFGSVPWHPGAILILADLPITLLALFGLRRTASSRPVFLWWLAVALLFLFLWPTKWPQYILVLTFPLAFAAAEGARALVWEPLTAAWRARGTRQPRIHARRGEAARAALWLLPGVVAVTVITFFPLLFQSGMMLTDFNARSIRDGLQGGVSRAALAGLTGQVEPPEEYSFWEPGRGQEVSYVGFRQFFEVLNGIPDVWVFNLLWMILSVALQVALGMGVALLLHTRGLRGRPVWMALFLLPWAIPEFVGVLSWIQVFSPDSGWVGLAASGSFGQTNGNPFAAAVTQWTNDPNLAMLVLLLVGLWMGWPLIMLAASAGLRLLPREVYEAAELDGAGGWQVFRTITWPLLFPLLTPIILLRAISAFNQFYLFWVFNPPWPVLTASSLSYYLFRYDNLYAGSATVNMITVLILAGMIVWFARSTRAGEGVTYA